MEDTVVQKIRIGQFGDDLIKAKAEKESIQLSYQAKIDVRISTNSNSFFQTLYISRL